MAKYNEWITDEGLLKIRGLVRRGLTDKQVAKEIKVSYSTFKSWKKRFPALSASLKKEKEVVDDQVEESLLKTMLGYKTTDVQYKMVKVDDVVLKAKRTKFMNEYKLDHPEAPKSEIVLAAATEVPTYEQIPLVKSVHEIGPNVTAIMFWLKNRRPEQYRDQTFRKLNEAQTRKAIADAGKAEIERKQLEDAGTAGITKIVFSDDLTPDKENDTDQEGGTDDGTDTQSK